MVQTLYGPFSELLTMEDLPLNGPIDDRQLKVLKNAAILVEDEHIIEVGSHSEMKGTSTFSTPVVAIPGLIDCHTHICFAGDRSKEYAMRLNGSTYQEIAKEGGGILNTVKATRNASEQELLAGILERAKTLLQNGITTCEVKTGYGLTIEDELKMLRAIKIANEQTPINLIPTCLAAHIVPPEFNDENEYLDHIINDLLPIVKKERLASRVDIFIEKGAFSEKAAERYLKRAQEMEFSVTIHADQFSSGGALLASKLQAQSADHLEVSNAETAKALAKSGVTAVVLPGASLGLGEPFAKAKMLLDEGCSLAIASDWNPGSAPMGDLLTQAALLSAAEKMSCASTFAGVTVRAARALGLNNRGIIKKGMRADLALFPSDHYQEILYRQGALKPLGCIVGGKYYES